MLIKKELESVPVMHPHGLDCTGNHDYITASKVVDLPRSGKVFVADFYKIKTEKHQMRFFSDGKTFQTYMVGSVSPWTQINPLRGLYSGAGSSVETDQEREAARAFFKTRDCFASRSVIDTVGEFVSGIGYEKRSRRAMSEVELRKKHFAMYPELPKDLKNYCEDHVFSATHIFISKLDKNKKRKGVCSHCHNSFPVPREARSGQEAVCPKCGRQAVYRGNWITAQIEEAEKICIAHKVDGQLLLRWTDVTRTYRWPDFKAEYGFDDYAYNLYLQDKNQQKIYFYKWFCAMYGYGPEWHRGRLGDYCYDSTYIYTRNLDEVFGTRYYNVNLRQGLENKDVEIPFVPLLNSLKKSPAAEYLFKMDLPYLAAGANRVDLLEDQKPSFSTVLGISAQLKPLYKEMNPTCSEHLAIRDYGGWVTKEDLMLYRKLNIRSYNSDIVSELLKTMSFRKFTTYFTKQMQANNKLKSGTILEYYRDYINMSQALEVDLTHKSVRFPANCVEAHNQMVSRYNTVKKELEERAHVEALSRIYPMVKSEGYERNGLCVILPESQADFIAEGQSLNHCVGTPRYYENHIKGEDMICFIRRTEQRDRPYFTMEVDMRNFRIVQLYGFGDCTAPGKIRAFAEEFVKHLRPGKAQRSA